ncbi:MAG TPA: helix-turn-helix transcriptional regulator [Eubacteriales bacterium]|jgi:transcriptional regulator with XRE-family HTH domain|nr:helix-turn-helix transcriptional regulator [Clostridia bacterium]HRR90500.1 helix-turn-helix transcriptional regulator [Eubacteriales bacterium]HRU84636.1 helix-turn-helix transcriptional regulator [Eubacteriales bacterium]
MTLGEVIEKILNESNLTMSAFAKKVGYSRQYIYDLIKNKEDTGHQRKIQLDTLKRICDATGYSLKRLLEDINYIERPLPPNTPNTVIAVGKNGERKEYQLSSSEVQVIMQMAEALKGKSR